jgi:hypothetical protein
MKMEEKERTTGYKQGLKKNKAQVRETSTI